MRFLIGMAALGCLAGCGDAPKEPGTEAQAPPGMASEITVELPPPLEPAKVELAGPGGRPARFGMRAPEPDSVTHAWAGVLRRNGFPCDRIASARQLERESGGALGIYRIECAAGGVYQGKRRANGRLYFRRWPGPPGRI